MPSVVARGQITIVDLNDAKQITAYIQPNYQAQIYNPDTNSYIPNLTNSNPLTVTPKVYVTGSSTNKISSCTGISYTINGTTVAAGATSGNYSVSSAGVLSIKANAPTSSSGYSITFNASYSDANDTGGQAMALEAQCVVVLSQSAGAALTAFVNYPNGNIFDTSVGSTTPTSLTAVVTAYRGGTQDKDFTATWQKLVGTSWSNVAASNVAKDNSAGTSTLTVNADDVLNHQIYRCTVTDNTPSSATAIILCSFEDKTDPYDVQVGSTTGDKIVNGQGSTTLFARVWQNGQMIESENTAVADRAFDYTWHKFGSDGNSSNFYNTSPASPTKTGNPLVVTHNDISVRATFVCEVSKKTS